MSPRSLRHTVIFAGAALLAGAVFAAPLAPEARRSELARRYRAALARPALLASAPARYDFARDREAIDRFLLAMPLSPLEFLKQDMQARRYEFALPSFLARAHVRWLELHPADARELYGDEAVTARLRGVSGTDATAVTRVAAPSVGTNRDVASTDVPGPDAYDGEVQVAVDPANPNRIVAAANTWGSAGAACDDDQTQSVFWSIDAGATWNYTCAPSNDVMALGTCNGTVFGSDPALAWNDAHEVFLNYMLICYTGSYKYAMVVAKSADGGATWSKQGVVKNSWSSSALEDKNFYAIDNTPASPYYGRHYTCWDRDNNEKIAYSTNKGVSWTEVDLPAAAKEVTYDLGCDLAIGRDGTVHVVFDTLNCGVSCTNERMFYTRSTNGGATWSTPVLVRDFNLVAFSDANYPAPQDERGIGPFGAIAVDNSGGPCDGTLYATFGDFASGGAADSDVWLSRSTDGGATWSASPLRVNDGGFAGRAQFHPFVQVDSWLGDVVVAWHDARGDANNRKVDFYATRSTDCGVSVESNVHVSAPSSEFANSGISYSDENSTDNLLNNPNQYGEYLGLDAAGGRAYVAWTDTRQYFPGSTNNSQRENVGFSVVAFDSGAADCGNHLVESPELCDGTNLAGQTCVAKGFSGGALACNGTCSAFVTSGCTASNPVSRTFTSVAAQDGWVREKSETANVGAYALATNTGSGALRAGDDASDRQLKSVVSFDTSALPDGATVTGATLRLKRGKVQGSNPFNLLGLLRADVSSAFGGNPALASGDFQAGAVATAVCSLTNATTNGAWSTCSFNAAGLAAISKTGRTQVRVAFAKDDNDDLGADWMGFYSGDNATASNRPQLVVTYQ